MCQGGRENEVNDRIGLLRRKRHIGKRGERRISLVVALLFVALAMLMGRL